MTLEQRIKQYASIIDRHLKRRHLAALSAFFFLMFILTALLPANSHNDEIKDSIVSENSSRILEMEAAIESPVETMIINQDNNAGSTAVSLLDQSEFEIDVDIYPIALPSQIIVNALPSSPTFTTNVQPGDNLSLIFNRAGLTAQDVYNISSSGSDANILSNLRPGNILSFNINDEGRLISLELIKTPLESVVFTHNDQSKYDIKIVTRTPTIEPLYKQADIQDSLFLAAQRGGISASITMEIAGIFGGVIDFLLDTRTGDTFNVLYEEEYLDGEYIDDGAILATQFTNQGRIYTALRYENEAGEAGYYNPQGESMRKAFLQNPIDYIRISSGFNLSRKHPILNTIRAHKGTDYAAPRGTPVVATSDGKVSWAARNGSFGKLVVIDHGERFQTKYAHLSDYARGIRNGSAVSQGQVIGYVGTTGSSTGPHLHYEFLMDGVHRNSRTIHDKLPKAESIPTSEMARFQEQTAELISQLETHSLSSNTDLAANSSTY